MSLAEMEAAFQCTENCSAREFLLRQGCFTADYQVANVLAADVTAEEPFQCITEEHYEQALKVLKSCRQVLCPLQDFGPGNEKNRKLKEEAEKLGLLQ